MHWGIEFFVIQGVEPFFHGVVELDDGGWASINGFDGDVMTFRVAESKCGSSQGWVKLSNNGLPGSDVSGMTVSGGEVSYDLLDKGEEGGSCWEIGP